MELGPSSLPFLDTNISVVGTNTDISVYRKETNTNLLLNFQSYAPFIYKKSLVLCFIRRAFTICSSWCLFDREISSLRDIFLKNGYPVTLFDHLLEKFLYQFLRERKTSPNDETRNKDSFTLVLPYFGQTLDNFRRKIASFGKKFNSPIRVVFKPFKTSFYFSLKTKCPLPLSSMVVYKYSCPLTGLSYIGKTKRHLLSRVREHKSPRSNSAIFNHIIECNCQVNLTDFSILYSANSEYDLNIAEALLIADRKPELNRNLANNGTSLFLKL